MILRSIISLVVCIFSLYVYAQIQGAPICNGTLAAWRNDRNMRQYLKTHRCDCRNGNRSPPVCVPISSSANSRRYTTPKSKQGNSKINTNAYILKKMQEHLRRQESLNKATMQKSRAAAIEGAKQINQAQTSNIQEEEYRRQKKIESEGLRDTLERQQISNELQGLSPNSAGQQLKSTNFHSELAEKLGKASSMDAAKKQASRGFDTEGSYAGEIPVVRIKSRDTTPIPQERMTLQMQNLMKKREQVRINKNELEQKLEKMEKKTNLSPEDKVEIVKIKQEISTTHNKEIYYDFSIDEELKKPSNEVAPNKNE